ncbi:hypothetical protein TWF730_002233 [Orbilia blumenaviensis]|uniref:WSC domain-containing protein n=1 Tax=Orbilia blumenaviensis TaxID=1796055 RepID=A0AAV9UFQ9_9PEZI
MTRPLTSSATATLTWTTAPLLLLVALLCPVAVVAQSISGSPSSPQATLAVHPGSSGYGYLGCYNETLDTTNDRAIYGGNVTKSTDMTVDKCLDVCKKGGSFNYAGLEYTSECWCGPYLSELSQKLEDAQCNLGCAGNNSEACGGALRVSVYKLASNSAVRGWDGLVSIHLVAILASTVCIIVAVL